MTRCAECGTPVDQIPLGPCSLHRAAMHDELIASRLASREGRIEELDKLISNLPDLSERDLDIKLILRHISGLLG